MPLLWVIPLALYLATFIIAFADSAEPLRRVAAAAAPYLVYALGALVLVRGETALGGFAWQLLLFFSAALGLHIALARRQPPAAQLTEFYLWMSIGGVIGGLFCALAAPLLFDWTYEHLVLIVAAAALLPAPLVPALLARPCASVMAAALARRLSPCSPASPCWPCSPAACAPGCSPSLFQLLFLLGFLAVGRPALRAFCVAMLMLAAGGWANLEVSLDPGARERSFFGVSTILDKRRRAAAQPGPRHHGPRRAEPRARPRDRAARLLCARQRHRRIDARRSRLCRRAGADRPGRPRRGHARLLLGAGPALDRLRDRSGRDPDRPRQRPLLLHLALPARPSNRRGRRPPDPRGRAVGRLRPARRRRFLVGRHPAPSADPRGVRRLCPNAGAARGHRDEHHQPLSRRRAGDRRRSPRERGWSGRIRHYLPDADGAGARRDRNRAGWCWRRTRRGSPRCLARPAPGRATGRRCAAGQASPPGPTIIRACCLCSACADRLARLSRCPPWSRRRRRARSPRCRSSAS